MLILCSHRFSILPWFQTMFRMGVAAICSAILCLSFFSVFIGNFTDAVVYREVAHAYSWDFGMIDKGLLSLRDNAREEASSLLHTLNIRAKNSRPDTHYNPGLPQMLLEIKGSSRTRTATSGERIYLLFDPLYNGEIARNGPPTPLSWSSEPGVLSFTPYIFSKADDGGDLFCQAILTDEEGRKSHEMPILIEGRCSNCGVLEKEPWLEKLQSSRFWTKDLFLDVYGHPSSGEQEQGEIKISFPAQERAFVLCAKEGDFLVYQDEEWVVASLEMATGKPLAKILKKEEGHLILRLWDSTGFLTNIISLSPQPAVDIKSKIESDFISPRLRSSSAVSCLLGKRRVVLKPGDWWLCEKSLSWRRLKRIAEIDDFLNFKCAGEIFVIDSLDKSQGYVLRGRVFDATRQLVQNISLPVAEGRGKAAIVKRYPHPRYSPTSHKKSDNETSHKETTPPLYLGDRGKQ